MEESKTNRSTILGLLGFAAYIVGFSYIIANNEANLEVKSTIDRGYKQLAHANLPINQNKAFYNRLKDFEIKYTNPTGLPPINIFNTGRDLALIRSEIEQIVQTSAQNSR